MFSCDGGAKYPPQVWHTNVPVWGLILALILPIVYVLPSGFIFAMTGQPVRASRRDVAERD